MEGRRETVEWWDGGFGRCLDDVSSSGAARPLGEECGSHERCANDALISNGLYVSGERSECARVVGAVACGCGVSV